MTREDEGSHDLLDTNLRDEIELVSDLVVAASGTDRHFTPDEVDALLGLQDEAAPSPIDGRTEALEPALPERGVTADPAGPYLAGA